MGLYKVTVEYEFFALTDSMDMACGLAVEASRDAGLADLAFAQTVEAADVHGADLEALVYGPDRDVTLREALQHTAKT